MIEQSPTEYEQLINIFKGAELYQQVGENK